MSAATSAGSPLVAAKRALRQLMRARREELSPEERARASRALGERLLSLPQVAAAGCLSGFVPTRGEIDVSTAVADRAAAGARILYPRVTAERPRLRFCAVTPDTRLAPGVFGILEPPEDSPGVPIEEIDVLLVPGLAFDAGGHRVGYGGGYYDETGAALRRAGRGILVGVGFDFQLIERCPAGEGDVPIDYVVTDARIIHCRPGPTPPREDHQSA
jgi:5-formyltetrahydrofolate cyclo-ligase